MGRVEHKPETAELMPSISLAAIDFPSGRLAFQPDAQDVSGSVDVAIVRRPAIRAIPASHSKPCDTSRPRRGQTATRRAGLGTPSLVYIDICGLPSGSLVPQHMAERRPSGVQDGLRHLGLCQLSGVHIADNDQTILPSNLRRLLVKVVTARVRDLRVNGAHPLLVSRPLSACQSVGVLSVMLKRGDLPAVAERGDVFQAEIDTNLAVASGHVIFNFAVEAYVPAAPGVFDKRAGFEFALDLSTLPELEWPLHVRDLASGDPNSPWDEDYPAERAPCAERGTKLWGSSPLVPGSYELPTNLIDRVRVKAKEQPATYREPAKIDCRWPPARGAAFPSRLGFSLHRNAVVPDLVTCRRITTQMATSRSILDAEFVGQKRHASFCHIPKNPATFCHLSAGDF